MAPGVFGGAFLMSFGVGRHSSLHVLYHECCCHVTLSDAHLFARTKRVCRSKQVAVAPGMTQTSSGTWNTLALCHVVFVCLKKSVDEVLLCAVYRAF